jgi:hypothetical protein
MNIYHLYENGKFDQRGEEHILCEVVEFDDGQVVAKWTGLIRSLVIHKNLDEFKQISLNDKRELYQVN